MAFENWSHLASWLWSRRLDVYLTSAASVITQPRQGRTTGKEGCSRAFTTACLRCGLPCLGLCLVSHAREPVLVPSTCISHIPLQHRNTGRTSKRHTDAPLTPTPTLPQPATSPPSTPRPSSPPPCYYKHTHKTCTTATRLALPRVHHQHHHRHKRPPAAVGNGGEKQPLHHPRREAR